MEIDRNSLAVDKTYVKEQQTFLSQVFGWMTMALCISAIVAFVVGNTYLGGFIFGSRVIFFGLIIVELLMVWYLSARVQNMSLSAASWTFVIYSLLNGITLGIIFLVYSGTSIGSTFLITAGMFGAMALYGYYTKRDLTSLGSLSLMALIGLIIASIVNIIWFNQILYWIITYIGVLVFVGLTAYDAQRIKEMNNNVDANSVEGKKLAIMGALALYLDFVNLFLYLLRLFGKKN